MMTVIAIGDRWVVVGGFGRAVADGFKTNERA